MSSPNYLVKHRQMFSTFSGALDMSPSSEEHPHSPLNLFRLQDIASVQELERTGSDGALLKIPR